MNSSDVIHDHYDVVIVGAGPAGAAAARAIAESGLTALIIDKCPLPRDKMCSGIIFPSSIQFIRDHLGDIPKSVLCEPREVKGNRVFLTNEAECMEVGFDAFDSRAGLPKAGLNALRSKIDFWLCEQSGADIAGHCFFDNYEIRGSEIIVKIGHGMRAREVRARYLIGADGPRSKVRRVVAPGFDERLNWLPLYEEWYEGTCNLAPGWLYVFFDRKITGYLATLFYKNGAMVVTTGVRPGEYAKEFHGAFITHLAKRHGLTVRKTTMKHGIVLNDMSGRRNYHLGEGNVILAGEAAGFLRGAEGITSALVMGMAAGKSVVRSSESGKTALAHYSTHELLLSERDRCEQVHCEMEQILGFNVFMRE